MGYEPRLISPFLDSGLNQFFKPFIIGDTAFPDIQDAYPWRGTVKKREGYTLLPGAPIPTFPVQGLKNWINPISLVPNLIAFSLTKSYNYVSEVFTDITQLFDGSTEFSFGTGTFNYYWTANFAGSMWTTNGLGYSTAGLPGAVNGILYLTSNSPNSWNIHTPLISGTTYLNGALMIIPYKGTLVALSTFEGPQTGGTGNVQLTNRARWCQLGNPYVTTYNTGSGTTGPTQPPAIYRPGDDLSWRSDIPGRGGFVDADTSEKIISAGIINDILIVGFQRSTWRLRFTGNQVLPFIWERLNTQYGAESTFSAVAFDKDILFFSRFGWIGSTTNEVQRIDEKLPDVSFMFETGDASNFDNLNTVQGIRDYYRQMAYWTFTPLNGINTEIWAYNYLDRSWSVFNPTNEINCFGETFNSVDETWPTFTKLWGEYSSPDLIWPNLGSSQNQGFPILLGGDGSTVAPVDGGTGGNIYQMFEFQGSPTSDNGIPFNFSITTKRFNPYFDKGQKCRMGYVDLYITPNTYGEIQFQHFVDDKPYPVFSRNVALYSRGPLDILSITTGITTTIVTVSAHNLVTGQQVVLSNVSGTIDRIINNQTVAVTVVDAVTFTVPIVTSNFTVTSNGYIWLPPFNPGDAKYTRVYLGAVGYHHQFVITISDQQLLDPIKSVSQFELQGLVIWTRPAGLIRG
jgi:hypothetical protein